MADDEGKGQAQADGEASPAGETNACAAAGSFDLEAALRKLLSDSSSQSIDLPATLTAAERKQAKQVVESHKGLTCESFGFGAERQLRVFKKSPTKGGAVASAPSGVSVKNTFIDDWIAPEWTDQNVRAVQSMPHGMFGKSLVAESSFASQAQQVQPAEISAAAPCEGTASAYSSALPPGSHVVIHGLTKCPAFNGLSAIVQHLDEASERYSVLLSTQQVAKIKAENLQLLAPPAPQQPPAFSPALADPYQMAPPSAPHFYADPSAIAAPPLRLTALV